MGLGALVQIESFRKEYGRKVAVSDLSLMVPAGSIFGLLGPNGAGKTTTLKALTGLIRPTKGTITVAGIRVWDDYQKARNIIGYVPDEPFLYPKLTGKEFLHFVGARPAQVTTSRPPAWRLCSPACIRSPRMRTVCQHSSKVL